LLHIADPKADLIAHIKTLDAQACSGDLTQIQRDEAEVGLFALWRAHDEDDRHWTSPAYGLLGGFFRRNDPLLAYEVFAAGLSQAPENLSLRYQQALTLVRLGAHERALEIATQLSSEQIEDPQLLTDVLGLIARLNKDLAFGAASPKKRKQYLELALKGYRHAYDRSQAGLKSYPAINAATLAMLLGKTAVARKLAKDARSHARAELRNAGSNSHWQVATIAEASFVLGEKEQAEQHYHEAVRLAGRRFDDIGSMRRNARTLGAHFGDSGNWVDDVLRIPSVVVFTGHMIDGPGRERARFPARLEGSIASAIEAELERFNAGFGFAGAACGSDILFLEAMMKRGHTRVVLPFSADEFMKTSVAVVPDGNWPDRFNNVLEHAEQVQIVSGAPSDWGGIVFEYANLLLLGLARLRSRALDTDLVGLAVWDRNPGDGPGGTAETVKSWREYGVKVVEISPSKYMDRSELDGTR
jgi:tetratricopeptide (TPR) repeat protein